MKLEAVVESPDDFEAWTQAQAVASPPLADEDPFAVLVQEGASALMRTGCIACHRVEGTPAQGTIGPDLSHVGSRRTIAAGILENNAENMDRWLRDPAAVKPGALMPNLQLSDEDIRSLTAYLSSLR